MKRFLGNLLKRSVSNIKTRARKVFSGNIILDSSKKITTLHALRVESVRLYDENTLAKSLIDIMCTNVIGSGLVPALTLNNIKNLKEDPDELEKEIIQNWQIWSKTKRSDYSGVTDFLDLQSQAYLSRLLMGEVFSIQRFNKKSGFTVQLIEGHRVGLSVNVGGFQISSDEENQGIEYSESGRPIKYLFDKQFPIDAHAADAREQVIHYFRQIRPGQMRGLPLLAGSIKDFKDLGQYLEYELKASIVAASFTAVIKSERRDPLGNSPLAKKGKEENADYDDDTDWAMKPGLIVALNPGESIDQLNPTRPNASFEKFYNTIVTNVASANGVPFNILIKKFDTSYTAARAAILEYWKTVTQERNFFGRRFCQEIFSQWLRFEIINKNIIIDGYLTDFKLSDRILNTVRWVGSAMAQIDEVKAVNAAKIRIDLGISDRDSETKKFGTGDFLDIAAKLKTENELLSFQREIK